MHGDDADTLGMSGIWFDPLWRIEVELTPLEKDLLDSPWVRRLALIAHAGAASLTTTQSYSRLEHSLGVLALVAHFEPHNHVARATALLHDIGHLPFSHTLEGIAGLEHHTLGHERIQTLAEVLERHGLSAEEVIEVDVEAVPSPLRGRPGGLKLDHLDSFLRSGQAHGRTRTTPPEVLTQLRLIGGTVDTDPTTAAELTRLTIGEARAQRAASNVVPVTVLRHLVETALANGETAFTPHGLATMTDDELWGTLLAAPSTSQETRAFRSNPASWRLLVEEGHERVDTAALLEHRITRSYLGLPTINGDLLENAESAQLQAELPLRFLTVRAKDSPNIALRTV